VIQFLDSASAFRESSYVGVSKGTSVVQIRVGALLRRAIELRSAQVGFPINKVVYRIVWDWSTKWTADPPSIEPDPWADPRAMTITLLLDKKEHANLKAQAARLGFEGLATMIRAMLSEEFAPR
jgi:hypothetical protein